MIDYNVVYVVVWGLAFISMLTERDQEKYIFYMQVLILALFLALKFETGYDWPVYEAHFLQVSAGGEFYLAFEVGYEFLVLIFSYMGFEFHQFVGFINIIGILLIASSVRYFFPKYSIWLMALLYALPDFYF